jgi:hypothetical protein
MLLLLEDLKKGTTVQMTLSNVAQTFLVVSNEEDLSYIFASKQK